MLLAREFDARLQLRLSQRIMSVCSLWLRPLMMLFANTKNAVVAPIFPIDRSLFVLEQMVFSRTPLDDKSCAFYR